MPPDHFDIWAGIGAIASSAVAVYGWLYSIGLAQLFMFIAGACFTMFAQERLEKKRRKRNREMKMTEHVYGPLHKELNSILIDLGAFQVPNATSLDHIIEDFRFSLAKEELGRRVREFRERLQPYYDLFLLARHETGFHVSMELRKHEIKDADENDVVFSVWLENQEIFKVWIAEPIFQDKSPLDYLTERTRPYKNVRIIVYVKGKSEGVFSTEHRIHQISKDILMKVREDPSVQEQRIQREHLIKECNALKEAIEKKIVL